MTEISVIIPTYNRPERLKNCLESFTKINYNQDLFEIIVVDDGSFQSLDNIIKNFEKKLNLTYIKQENSGPATARNNGGKKAQGKYLAFTDDDCEPDKEWLCHFSEVWASSPNTVLGGKTINKLTNNIYSQASQCLVDYLYKYYNSSIKKAQFFTSNNFAIPQHIFEELGGFNTTFPLAAGEDRELCYRIFKKDCTMIYIEKAIIYHSHLLNFKSFWRQHFNYGQGAKHFHSIKAEKMKVEPIKFYSQLLTYPLELKTNNYQKLSTIFLFLLSQIANIFGFCYSLISLKKVNYPDKILVISSVNKQKVKTYS